MKKTNYIKKVVCTEVLLIKNIVRLYWCHKNYYHILLLSCLVSTSGVAWGGAAQYKLHKILLFFIFKYVISRFFIFKLHKQLKLSIEIKK